ncbi:hypothetical protein JD844_031306 [Phrynosoma platyrhinos]|uniref:Ig-like domain-containing protein n=1 Tax=Phrynosoma platyrhinos TaxID=52577 RepID=A0ABQ7T0R0_PHRPL|nr:hypothetical protein JD844_031306 [Phrynosoma platyrhinos]
MSGTAKVEDLDLRQRLNFLYSMPSYNVSLAINDTKETDSGQYMCTVNVAGDTTKMGKNTGLVNLTVLDHVKGILTLKNLTTDMSGTYICNASSSAGYSNCTITLEEGWAEARSLPRATPPPSAVWQQDLGGKTAVRPGKGIKCPPKNTASSSTAKQWQRGRRKTGQRPGARPEQHLLWRQCGSRQRRQDSCEARQGHKMLTQKHRLQQHGDEAAVGPQEGWVEARSPPRATPPLAAARQWQQGSCEARQGHKMPAQKHHLHQHGDATAAGPQEGCAEARSPPRATPSPAVAWQRQLRQGS